MPCVHSQSFASIIQPTIEKNYFFFISKKVPKAKLESATGQFTTLDP